MILDSGRREEMATGAMRDDRTGKGRYDLLPARAIGRLARHFEAGSAKYGDRNWEMGMPTGRMLDSAIRHVFRYMAGDRDEDHLIAAAWNLLALVEIQERIGDGILPESLETIPVPGESGRAAGNAQNLGGKSR